MKGLSKIIVCHIYKYICVYVYIFCVCLSEYLCVSVCVEFHLGMNQLKTFLMNTEYNTEKSLGVKQNCFWVG